VKKIIFLNNSNKVSEILVHIKSSHNHCHYKVINISLKDILKYKKKK